VLGRGIICTPNNTSHPAAPGVPHTAHPTPSIAGGVGLRMVGGVASELQLLQTPVESGPRSPCRARWSATHVATANPTAPSERLLSIFCAAPAFYQRSGSSSEVAAARSLAKLFKEFESKKKKPPVAELIGHGGEIGRQRTGCIKTRDSQAHLASSARLCRLSDASYDACSCLLACFLST